MTNPRSFQAEARITEGMAHVGSVHQPGWGRCRCPRMALTRPLLGLRSHCHTRATTTQLVTTGRKYAERKKDLPRNAWLRAIARPRPPTYTSGR